MSKYIKFFCVALLLLCMLQIPQKVKAYSFGYWEKGYDFESDVVRQWMESKADVDSFAYCYIRNLTTGQKFILRMRFDGLDATISYYGEEYGGQAFVDRYCELYVVSDDGVKYVDYTGGGYPLDIPLKASDGLYIVGYGSVVWKYGLETVYEPSNGPPVPTDIPSPTPTLTPSPVPVPNFDMSKTGFVESMSVALEFMRIPIEIAGFEVNMFEIMMFGFACTIVIYLVFAPVKK